ncbi:hypothetical protein [Endozoicomonas acroporae]|uniref:hypothetical protein n=1 Tax=Endozoicomonas acroporae TaxID=1701104 RepID=UPI003D78B54E
MRFSILWGILLFLSFQVDGLQGSRVELGGNQPFINMPDDNFSEVWSGEETLVLKTSFCLTDSSGDDMKELRFGPLSTGLYRSGLNDSFISKVVFTGKGKAVEGKEIELQPDRTSVATIASGSSSSPSQCSDYEFELQIHIASKKIEALDLPGLHKAWLEFTVESASRQELKIIRIDLGIKTLYRISGLSDVEITPDDGGGAWLWKEMLFCVHGTHGAYYKVSLKSARRPLEDFYLSDSTNRNRIHYRISLMGDGSSNWSIFYGPGKSKYKYRSSRSKICNGSTNARLRVEVLKSGLPARSAGSYSDVMEITIEP